MVIKKELKLKTGEYNNSYVVKTNYQIIGAAAIYVPAEFVYICNMTVKDRTSEHEFQFNVIDGSIVVPKCGCKKKLYRAHLCDNNHLSCSKCLSFCSECQACLSADICLSAMYFLLTLVMLCLTAF